MRIGTAATQVAGDRLAHVVGFEFGAFAFVAAQELGGVGIKLGTGDTAARLRIANVESVHALIRGLGELAKQERSGPDQ